MHCVIANKSGYMFWMLQIDSHTYNQNTIQHNSQVLL